MRYDREHYDQLYQQWVETFTQLDAAQQLDQFTQVTRSKLTSLLGSAQVLADDLHYYSYGNDELVLLIDTVIQSGRSISILLDAVENITEEQSDRQTHHLTS